MKYLLICCLAFVLVAGNPQASTAIETTTEDENCIEVEAIKEYYCKTDRCKDFYTKNCYDLVDNKAPPCITVKKCIEDRVQHYKDHVENLHNKNSSPQSFQSCLHLVLTLIILAVANAFNNTF
jgi:hypothetical protein